MNSTQVDELFLEAMAEPTAETRAAFLDRACHGNAELREKVDALLAAHEAAGSFLELPESDEATVPISPLSERPGTIIGPYKLLQQIGEGGMGVVFMAEQTEPIQRTVALKIIKPGMDTRQVIARFEAERQALAIMDHPNIARVVEAGTTETGRPYFVMELVKGVPITKYCDDKQLSVRERLELFIPVCQAVQHAHQKGIIHRDIKPTNILVAEYDNHAVPKVIDFGVAKATAQKLTERTMFTEFGQIIGTVEYMSPEQAKFNQLDIDTRSDIYSLGVLLYELLAGSTPFEKSRLREAAFDEALRIIREEEPPKPSTRLTTLAHDQASTISAKRGTESHELSILLRGDLDWIAMKCLEKERNRRYETVSALTEDLERYLRIEPVLACPPSATYRLRKFVRRNKTGTITTIAVCLGLLLGLTLASVGFWRARTEAARSTQVAQFLKQMLAGAGPSVAHGRDSTLLREILDQTAKRVEQDLNGQPEIQGDLWCTLGLTYSDIGEHSSALNCYQQAVGSYRKASGDENPKPALALGYLGGMQTYQGSEVSGSRSAMEGLQIARRRADQETLATCLVYTGLALGTSDGHTSQNGEAIPYFREALSIRQRLGNDPKGVAECMGYLAGELRYPDDEEAVKFARDSLAIYREQLPPNHPKIALALHFLGQRLYHRKPIDAIPIFQEGVEVCEKTYPPEHYLRTRSTGFLALALLDSSKPDEAESVLRHATETAPTNKGNWFYLAGFYAIRERWADAIESAKKAVQLNQNDSSYLCTLTVALLQADRIDEYRAACHQSLEIAEKNHELSSAGAAATSSLLLPVEGDDFKRACELAAFAGVTEKDAEKSDRREQKSWNRLVTALASYRQEHLESAIEQATLAQSDENGWPECRASASYIRAAIDARNLHLDSARKDIDLGDQWLDKANVDLASWPDATIAKRLRSEAVGLVDKLEAKKEGP